MTVHDSEGDVRLQRVEPDRVAHDAALLHVGDFANLGEAAQTLLEPKKRWASLSLFETVKPYLPDRVSISLIKAIRLMRSSY